ncbi:MAG: NnrU family protein [Rhodospirillum sp.]|nr:NnrU family protein [Rhodospirillum sp.]MCF8491231.1 NnrU family protein [Rhodospirillum sp.]MCF8502732.1 NnrU family protein [Rhodospirillum sp.]
MGGFGELVLALGVFLGSHAVAGMPGVRARLVGAGGERAYLILYSALSLGLLGWLISAAQRAPYLELWPPQPWAPHLLVAGMPVVAILWTATLTEANPFSLSVNRRAFDPNRPGLPGLVRHPLFVGFALWAAGHVVANGDLAGLLLFGPMLILSLLGPLVARRKAARRHGAERLAQWDRAMAAAPLSRKLPGVRTVLYGLLLYFALLGLHGPLFGIDPTALVG